MAISDYEGNAYGVGIKQGTEVLVASFEAPSEIKASADYVCTGANDELVIQNAINYIANKGGGKIYLSKGRFIIDSFPYTDDGGDYVALILPITGQNPYDIQILGAQLPYGYGKEGDSLEGTRITVSQTCYDNLDSETQYSIIRSGYVTWLSQATIKVALTMKDVVLQLPANQKKIICINALYCNGLDLEKVNFRAGTGTYPVAVEGCVGLRMMSGSNSGRYQNITNVGAVGFYEGFQMGSEHVVGINLYALWCVYGYTFGNYNWMANFNHDITLINCCDEKNVNLPLFKAMGRKQTYTSTPTGGPQAISLFDFNMERYKDSPTGNCPGDVLGDHAKETTPGSFRGTIEYTIMTSISTNDTTEPFWEDGHGKNFVTRNRAHALSGSSTVRRGYKPTYLQQFYDTTVGKMLWCVDTATPTWKDGDGNTVA